MQRIAWIMALLAALAAPPLMAGKIYKWSDPEGHIHYGEVPPSGRAAQTIESQTPPEPPRARHPATAPPEVSSRSDTEKTPSTPDTGDRRSPSTAQDAEPLAEQCRNARQNLKNLQIGGSNRRFRDSSGKIVRYTHAERQAKIDATRAYLEQYCAAD